MQQWSIGWGWRMKQHEQSGAVPYKKTQASGTVGFKTESYGNGVKVTGRSRTVEPKMMPTPAAPKLAYCMVERVHSYRK